MFYTYLKLGFQHILDMNGYDHIVFIVALCALYSLKEWKQVAVLVTAFTIGHSLTLGLAIFDIIRFPSDIIEKLIPITIMLTCLANIFFTKKEVTDSHKGYLNYYLAIGFGLIHGMGFSNFLRAAMLPGETSIFKQLFAFNIGIEIGQLIIVMTLLLISYIATELFKIPRRTWLVTLSVLAFGVALRILIGF